ncbi:MAG: DUF2290 domain-containing protein [Bacteroidales bacterium]|nr:DUF2290 domain-containing protein [Bacteroidales bacterium]
MKRVDVLNQIMRITSALISVNLCEEQNFPSEKDGEIYISGNHDLSIALKNLPYQEIYSILNDEKNFNLKMIDGALIQLMYSFDHEDNLQKSRLAFFPSPDLTEFQNNSEIYELDYIYADMLFKNIVTVPIRFDYDPGNFMPMHHPSSHLTFGQYDNCRIPVVGPITPNMFMDFIIRNFYNTAFRKYADELNFDLIKIFNDNIHELEQRIVHVSIQG